MAIAIEIRYTRHIPAGRNSWTIRTADVEIIIQIPDRGLTRAGVVKRIIWFAVAVEVNYRSPVWNSPLQVIGWKARGQLTPEAKVVRTPLRSKLKKALLPALPIRDKQVVRAVNGQTIWNWIMLIDCFPRRQCFAPQME